MAHPWPEVFKASFSRTNQTANKRKRLKKRVKISPNVTFLHKTRPGQKLLEISQIFFEDVYSPDLWVSRFGCRFKYLTLWWSYTRPKHLIPILRLPGFVTFLQTSLKGPLERKFLLMQMSGTVERYRVLCLISFSSFALILSYS